MAGLLDAHNFSPKGATWQRKIFEAKSEVEKQKSLLDFEGSKEVNAGRLKARSFSVLPTQMKIFL